MIVSHQLVGYRAFVEFTIGSMATLGRIWVNVAMPFRSSDAFVVFAKLVRGRLSRHG